MMKVMLVVNTDGALYVFRKPIIKALLSENNQVVTISSESDYFQKLRDLGVSPAALDFSRHSVSPLGNLKLLIGLIRKIRSASPEVVHNFTHKPAIYGTIAAKISGVKAILVTITGLGTLFVHDDVKTRLLRFLLLIQYKVAMKFVDTVFFQNPDDLNYFVSRRIVRASQAVLTNGSGVDLDELKLPDQSEIDEMRVRLSREVSVDLTDRVVIVFPARGLKEKGFSEFYEASRVLNRLCPGRYFFMHLGHMDSDPLLTSSHGRIDDYAGDCGVTYLGFKDNIEDYIVASDIVVLPSYYREGTPRSLIEALALGKCIITTRMPGCKETVIDGWNGLFCQSRDVGSLVEKILTLSESNFGDCAGRSRRLCEVKFDANIIVKTTLNYYHKGLFKNECN